MSDSKIKVYSNDFIANLNLLKSEIDKMSTLFEEVTTKTNEMNGFWKGNDSEVVDAAMKSFTSTFDEISQNNKKYTTFLNTTIERYSSMDTAISNVAGDSTGLGINGS